MVIAENLILKQQLIIHWNGHLTALSNPVGDQATAGFLAGILGLRFDLVIRAPFFSTTCGLKRNSA